MKLFVLVAHEDKETYWDWEFMWLKIPGMPRKLCFLMNIHQRLLTIKYVTYRGTSGYTYLYGRQHALESTYKN